MIYTEPNLDDLTQRMERVDLADIQFWPPVCPHILMVSIYTSRRWRQR